MALVLRDLWRWFGGDWGRALSAFAAVVVFGWMTTALVESNTHHAEVIARMDQLTREQEQKRKSQFAELVETVQAALDDAKEEQLVTIDGWFSSAASSMQDITRRRDSVVRAIALKVGITEADVDAIFAGAGQMASPYPSREAK